MNQNRNIPHTQSFQAPPPSVSAQEHDYQYMDQPDMIVEHRTIPGFLRRISHRWHMADINRFGDQVGRAAQAMHLAYMTTTDSSLGVIRCFPVPMMNRVYEIMALQMNWPPLTGPDSALAAPKSPRETTKANQRVVQHLRALLDSASDIEVARSIAVVLDYVGKDSERIRTEENGDGAQQAPAAAATAGAAK